MGTFFVNDHICSDFGSKSPIFSNLEVRKKKTRRSRFLKIASNIKKGYMHNISENKKNLRSQF